MWYIIKLVLTISATIHYSDCKICQRLPPGMEKLISGIDITQLDLIPIGITKSNGFNYAILELTCNTTRKWTNPVDPSKVYDIPDQIESIISLPQGIMDFKLNVYKTNEDVKKSMSESAGIDFLPGFFSLSGSYSQSQESILKKFNLITEMSAFVSAHKIVVKPFWQQTLAESVQQYINKYLPKSGNYLNSPTKYQDFLSTFGTHFFTNGYFGGFLSTKIETSEMYAKNIKDATIQAEAKAIFFNLIKLQGGYTGSTYKVSEEFKKYSHIHEAYYGGKADIFSSIPSAYSQWLKTVEGNPWLFGGKLLPITQLLPESATKDALSQAIQVRLDKAYIQDLLNSLKYIYLESAPKNGPNFIKNIYNNEYQSQLLVFNREQVISNRGNFIQLGKKIEAFAKSQLSHKVHTRYFQPINITAIKHRSLTGNSKPITGISINSVSSISHFQNYSNFTIVNMSSKFLSIL